MRLGMVLTALLVTLALRPCAATAVPGDDRFAVAASHYDSQRWELAADEFQTLLAEFPQYGRKNEALFFAGESLVQLQRYDEAAERFGAFLEQAPDHELAPRAIFRQGESLYLAGKIEAAIGPFAAFLKQNAEHPLSNYARPYLAHAYLAAAESNYNADNNSEDQQLTAAKQLYKTALDDASHDDAPQDAASRDGSRPQAGLARQCRFGLARIHHIAQQFAKATEGYQALLDCPDTVIAAQSHFYLGEILAANKDHTAATAIYEALLNVAPESRWAKAIRGPLVLEYARSNDFEAARTAMQQWQAAIAPETPNRGITATVARLARQAGENEWAEQLFQQLADTAEETGQRADGLAELAATQLRAGQLDQAVATLEKLTKTHEQDQHKAETAYLRAATLHKLGRRGEAIDAYLSVLDLCHDCPLGARSLHRAAQLYETQDDKVRAVELYERLADQPESPSWRKAEISTALYHGAWLLHELGRTEQAVGRFAELHDQHHESKYWPDATYRVAEQAFADGDIQRTRKTLADLLGDTDRTELHPHALYLDARAAQKSEGWDAMRKPLRRLLEEHPDSELRLTAEYWLAEAAYQLKAHDQAEQQFDQLAGQIGKAPADWRWNVPLRQAQLSAMKTEWSQVHQHCTEIIHHAPDFDQMPEVNYLMGRYHLAKAEFDQARLAFQKVAPSDGAVKTETAAMAQWMIGESYMHQQNYQLAITEYFRVEALYGYPRWQAAALLQAGKCYEQLNNRTEALKQYQRIQNQYPETMFVNEATQRLHADQ